MTTQEPKATHRSTQRVLDVLTTLASSDEGMSMADICRTLGAPKSSLFPILHTMADMDYISYEPDTARYSLGLRSYLLSSSYERRGGILPVFKSAMSEIVSTCGETSQLGILDHGRVLYIAKVDSTQPVQLKSNIGTTLGPSYTAIGKALLADRPDNEIRSLLGSSLEAPTRHAAKTIEEFLDNLSEVRETGFAYDREETTEGVQCIAVPVRHQGRHAYGLSVTVPSYRLTREREALIKQALARAKGHVEQLLS